MFAHYAISQLPMQFDRNLVETAGACAEGV